jgi:superfamily II DNA or RNA helicase
MTVTDLRPYQVDALNQIREYYAKGERKVLLHLATGGGKCHGPGTLIMMHKSARPKLVESIVCGDKLMGPDSTPRTVKSICQGIDQMFAILPKKGEPFTCNLAHKLVLYHRGQKKVFVMSVQDFLKLNKRAQSYYYLMRFKWDHDYLATTLADPWMAGFYLGAGDFAHEDVKMTIRPQHAPVLDFVRRHAHVDRDFIINANTQLADKLLRIKHKNDAALDYLMCNESIRKDFLSGYIDALGIIPLKEKRILIKANPHIQKICWSLRLDYQPSDKLAWISGDTWDLPLKILKIEKPTVRDDSNQFSQFTIKPLGVGDYYGFELKYDPFYLLHDGTVSHNTVIFSEVLKGVHQKKKRAIMVVRGKQLVDQASQRLFRENVPHGVLMAGHWNRKPNELIQICSIDTLKRRGIVPPAELCVIDEAHYAGSDSFRWLIEQYPEGTFFLPVTATPHVTTGLRHCANQVVYPISILDLIKQGYLVPPKYYSCPNDADFGKLKIDKKTGDFLTADIDGIMGEVKIVGDIVKTWIAKGQNRPTICFATGVSNSKRLVDEFIRAGVKAVHIEAKNTFDERQEALNGLRNGEVKIVSNVGILCTGVDMPYVSCIIMARPTASYNLFIQQLGRGTRPFENKSDFIVLDHGKNVPRHGFIENEKECDLDGTPKKSDDPLIQYTTCLECYFIYASAEFDKCPQCGAEKPKKEIKHPIHRTDIELVEIKDIEQVNEQRVISRVQSLIRTAAARGYKPGWAYYKIKTEFGDRYAKRHWGEISAGIDKAAREFGEDDPFAFE